MSDTEAMDYNHKMSEIRGTEFARLKDLVYLDHAGATLYTRTHIDAFHNDLVSNVYSNPHSTSDNGGNDTTGDLVDSVRKQILEHFHTTTDEYSVVFTSGATGSLKLLSEIFQFVRNDSVIVEDVIEVNELAETAELAHNVTDAEREDVRVEDVIEEKDELPETVELAHDFTDAERRDVKDYITDDVAEVVEIFAEESLQECGCLAYLMDNHTSVLGMREVARRKGARVLCINMNSTKSNETCYLTMRNSSQSNRRRIQPLQGCAYSKTSPVANIIDRKSNRGFSQNNLLVYPAMSNFSGVKYPANLLEDLKLERVHSGDWYCCIDAAAFASTSDLDLSIWKSDFVSISFYKMFGFPTGLGALLVRNTSGSVLQKTYFGGGTVASQVADSAMVKFRTDISEKFEDGTVSFLDIVAVKHGFETLKHVVGTSKQISRHTFHLAKLVHDFLTEYRHKNGNPIAKVYCKDNFTIENHGAIIAFNLLTNDGAFIGFSVVEKLAAVYDIQLRTGCVCNIGACQTWLGFSAETINEQHDAGHECGDGMDILDGYPTGMVRISFSFSSTIDDVERFIHFITECFVTNRSKTKTIETTDDKVDNILEQINVYPIKSCAAFRPSHWMIGSRGLLYDRDWAIINESSVILTQKRNQNLCKIRPRIDLEEQVLVLSHDEASDISIPLSYNDGRLISIKVCNDKISGFDCGDNVAEWLNLVLNTRGCRLIKYNEDSVRKCRRSTSKFSSTSLSSSSSLSSTNMNLASSLPNKNHASLSLANDIPVSLSLANETPAPLSLANETSASLSLANEIPASLSLANANEIPASLSIANEIPASLSVANDIPASLSLANETQYIAITTATCRALHQTLKHLGEDLNIENLMDRFRANYVIRTSLTSSEDGWRTLTIGQSKMEAVGQCQRCQIICIDQSNAERNALVLKALRDWTDGKRLSFGIQLQNSTSVFRNDNTPIKVGDKVIVTTFL